MEILGIIDIPAIIFYPAVIGILLYVYTKHKFSYWKKQGVPAPTPLPFIGNFGVLFKREVPMHEHDVANYKKFGRTFGLYEPSANMLIVSDPEDIKTVLVKDFDCFSERRPPFVENDMFFDNSLTAVRGEKWNAIRNVITPTFSAAKMKHMMNDLVTYSEELTAHLMELAKTTKSFDPRSIFGAYTLDVIASTAFCTQINSLKNPDNEFAKHAKKAFSSGVGWRVLLFVLFPKIASKLGVSLLDPSMSKFFSNVIKKIIKMRQGENKKSSDFLGILKESARDDAFDENKPAKPKSNEPWKKESNKFMTGDMILAQCVLFFIAGYDTTATTLSFLAYNLATHPECQDRLIEEIDEAVRKHGKLTYEAIGELPYLKAVTKENLRIFSPATRLEREVQENYQLGDIFLEKGTLIGIPVYCIHHDAEHWPNPETFDPERFMGDQSEINPYTYLPFGLGRRNCVAMRFAEFEVKVAIATILTKLKFVKIPEAPVPMVFKKGSILLQAENLQLGIELREEK